MNNGAQKYIIKKIYIIRCYKGDLETGCSMFDSHIDYMKNRDAFNIGRILLLEKAEKLLKTTEEKEITDFYSKYSKDFCKKTWLKTLETDLKKKKKIFTTRLKEGEIFKLKKRKGKEFWFCYNYYFFKVFSKKVKITLDN